MKRLDVTNKKEYDVVKDSIRKLYELKKQKEDFDRYYESVKKKEQLIVSNYMYAFLPKGTKNFSVKLDEGLGFYDNHVDLKVSSIRRTKINWNIEKLKNRLSKSILSKVISKEYRITDMQGLIEYLKSCGVNPKKFKQFIDVVEKVETSKIDELSEIGDIDKKDIDGCYEIEVSEPYIRLSEVGSREDEETV